MENNDYIKGLGHISLGVLNLQVSIEFYGSVLGLKQIERPDFEFDGAWFALGSGINLHLIENDETRVHFSNSRAFHVALSVHNISKVKIHLTDMGIDIIKDINVRPDGVKQMFIKDPDGYFIEFSEI